MKAFGIQQRIQRRLDYFSGSSSMIWRSQFFSNWTSRGKRSFSVLIFSIAKKRCDIAFLDKLILDKHYVLIFSYLYFLRYFFSTVFSIDGSFWQCIDFRRILSSSCNEPDNFWEAIGAEYIQIHCIWQHEYSLQIKGLLSIIIIINDFLSVLGFTGSFLQKSFLWRWHTKYRWTRI